MISLDNLTQGELKILRFITKGYNNTEISHELGISLNTVKSHVSKILQKLQCENRIKLVYKVAKYTDF